MTQPPGEYIPAAKRELREMLPVVQRKERQLTPPSREVVDERFQMFSTVMALREGDNFRDLVFQFRQRSL